MGQLCAAFGTTERLHPGRGPPNEINIRTKFCNTGNICGKCRDVLHFSLPSAARCAKSKSGGVAASFWRQLVSGFGRILLIAGVVGTVAGIASLRAQTQLSDPKDAPKIFASTCSACHKSPQGLAKSGQVAGFLRQHYTTGPEMSAAMAAYLVAAGNAPAGKKKDEAKTAAAGAENPATKSKQKKQEHAVIDPVNERANPDPAKQAKERRAKELQQAKAKEERPPVHPSPASAADAANRQAAVTPAPAPATPPASAPTAAVPESKPATMPDGTPLVTLDIPMPEMPSAPPADLTQSVFSSSPVP